MELYDVEVTRLIVDRLGVDELTALRLFTGSETYAMLADDDLKMWYFSPLAIYDLWETERATGDPRNSLYLRGDDFAVE
jgi:hypothetical protein